MAPAEWGNNPNLNVQYQAHTLRSRGANYPHVEKAKEGPKAIQPARFTAPMGGLRAFAARRMDVRCTEKCSFADTPLK